MPGDGIDNVDLDFTKADFGSMNAAQIYVLGELKNLQGILNNLEDTLENKYLRYWTGAAKNEYHIQKRRWDAAALRIAQALHQQAGVVGIARENLMRAERANQELFSPNG